MIRSLYPVDLVSLLFFSRRALPNEPTARDSLGQRSLLSPEVLLEQWLPFRGKRHTWVSVERGRVLGVVSIRSRFGPTACQIDYLQADEERCLALLDQVSTAVSGRGVRKLFLRLPSTSPLIDVARRASFSCYTEDYLFRYGGGGVQMTAEAPEPYLIRLKASGDEWGLFDLYNAAVPIQVRTAEGVTLEEWLEAGDRGFWLEQRREFVLEKQGSLVAWLRVGAARGMGWFDIMFHQLDEDRLGWLVNYGLVSLDGKSPIFCVVSAFQQQLVRLLKELGFEEETGYSTLVKETAVRVREPHFAPMRA